MRDERIIQVPGCDDCIGLGHDKNLVSVVVTRLGDVVSIAYIWTIGRPGQRLDDLKSIRADPITVFCKKKKRFETCYFVTQNVGNHDHF